jgi:hypothetical protein
MTCTYLSQFIVLLKIASPAILPLQHARLQLSLDGAGLCGLDVDSLNSISDFAYFSILQVIQCFIRKECQLRIDLTLDDKL